MNKIKDKVTINYEVFDKNESYGHYVSIAALETFLILSPKPEQVMSPALPGSGF